MIIAQDVVFRFHEFGFMGPSSVVAGDRASGIVFSESSLVHIAGQALSFLTADSIKHHDDNGAL